MTAPVPAAITATQQEARREDHGPAFPIKIFAFDGRCIVRVGTHPRFIIPPSYALIKLSSPQRHRGHEGGTEKDNLKFKM
jgi:hypothetical protein